METHGIEEELAHLRRAVEEMSDELARRGLEIDRLNRQVALLMQRAAEQEQDAAGGVVIAQERPPHY